MEGFLLRLLAHTQVPHLPFSVHSLPNSIPVSLKQTLITPQLELHSWGNDPGDIHISYKPNKTLLILVGYVTQSSYLAEFTTQQEACDQLCHLLEKKDPEFFLPELARSIYGSFTLIYIRLETHTIYTSTDRVGSRPLWHHGSREDIWISTNAIALARLSGKKSYYPGGLVGYFLYATAIEPTKSIFSHISCQSEGSLLIHRLGNSPTEKKWYSFQHMPDLDRSLDEWVKLASDRFVEAARRILRINPNPLLFLSGGVDSRLAGAAFIAAGGNPLLCTLSDSANLEVIIAKAVAHVFQCQHKIIIRDDEWYLRSISEAVLSSNGTYSWAHSHFRKAYKQLQLLQTIDAAILGDFCEAFSKIFYDGSKERRQIWSTEEFVAEFDTLPLPLYRPVNREITLELFKKDFRQEAVRLLKYDIENRYMTASKVSSDPLIVSDYFFRWQAASCVATFQMFNDVRTAGPDRNLMFDKDLHQLLEIMPSAIRSKNQLGARIVRHLHPRAALVPNSNTLLPLLFPGFLNSFARAAKPKFGKIRRLLFSNTYKTTASWPDLPLLYARHPAWKEKIENNLLEAVGLPEEIFDRASVEQCWREFCAGDLNRHTDVERLLGVSILSELIDK